MSSPRLPSDSHPSSPGSMPRREFVAATTAAYLAAQLPADEPPGSERLALQGGAKAVSTALPPRVRWGAPEGARLEAMLQQRSLFYWKGPQTAALVERFRNLCPLQYVQTCSSGTAALHIAVAAAGIAPGDEVITTPITDVGTVIGVIYQQGVPVFADLAPSTYNLDPADVERRITPRTKAIIAVHLCGNPCELRTLRELADRNGLVLIEDCAQAWGARYRGQPVGTFGHIACFSLQDSKHVTCGDGGLVASGDPRFGPRLQPFGDKGMDRTQGGGLFAHFATNYRMSEPQAAVAAAQLDRVPSIAGRRAQLGNRLTAALRGIAGLVPHEVHPEDVCTYWFYYFRLQPAAWRCERGEFVKALAAEGVPCSAGYIPVPLHRNPVFQQHGFFAGHWPVRDLGLTTMDYSQHTTPEAEAILQTGVRIAIYEQMDESYVDQLAAGVRKVARYYAA
ncbi:MAG: DegT/DnrJ/EryC1/StrS family aminotransferase [Pirellulaceae bacterium]